MVSWFRSGRSSQLGPRVVWLGAAAFLATCLTVTVASGNVDEPARPLGAPNAVSLNAALTAFTTAHGYFLKVPGILGDSAEAGHPNEIDVRTVSWGVTNANGTTSGAVINDLTVRKFIDTSMRLTYMRHPDGSTTSVTGCEISPRTSPASCMPRASEVPRPFSAPS